MKITVAMLKETMKEVVLDNKKFKRIKEKQAKGCFWQVNKDGTTTCIVRYNFRGNNKVYIVAEVGSALGQVSMGTALSMAKKTAKDIAAGGDPQGFYKAEKTEKKLAEKARKDPRRDDDIYVNDKAEEYYRYNPSIPSTKRLIRSALDEIVLAFGEKRVVDVTKQDVINLLLKLESRGKEGKYSIAINVQKYGRAMWNWGLDVGGFEEVTNYFGVLASIRKRQKAKGKGRIMNLEHTREMAEKHFHTFPEGFKRAILLQAYTCVRSGNVTAAEPLKAGGEFYPIDWSDFNLDTGVWHIPAIKMKGRQREHIIDMPKQLIAHVKLWHKEDGYPEKGVVVRAEQRPYGMTKTTNLAAAYRHRNLGYTPHDWRHNISSEIADMKGAGKEIADFILAHYTADNYIQTTRRDERKEWLQVWADKLDTLGFDKLLMNAKKSAIDLKVISS